MNWATTAPDAATPVTCKRPCASVSSLSCKPAGQGRNLRLGGIVVGTHVGVLLQLLAQQRQRRLVAGIARRLLLGALACQLVNQHHATKRQDCTAKQHPLEAPKHRAALPLAPR
ncbi:hypothetical protein D3C80_1121190 [compost metagenome]